MGLVSLYHIEEASRRIRGVAIRTPLLPAVWAPDRYPLWLKPESLQPTGAFKLRGATNKVASLTDEERAAGIVAHSSGNHAQAVAHAARFYGANAVIVMPETVPAVKLEATRRLGAEVVLVPASEQSSRSAELAEEYGYTNVHPYDDPLVIAGQGTVGLEIVDDLPEVATVLAPISGGGLISGVATAVKERRPKARVIGVEPELAGDAAEGMRRAERVVWSSELTNRTMADGLRSEGVGQLTWEHIRRYVDDIITVTEEQIREAMRVLAYRSRLVAEASGAVTTAAYLFHGEALQLSGDTVSVLSGGNVDPQQFSEVLAG